MVTTSAKIEALRSLDITEIKRALQTPEGAQLVEKLVGLKADLDLIEEAFRTKPALGYIPNPGQERFHRSRARGRGFFAGNRSGKTTALVLEAYAHTLGYRPWLEPDDPDYRINDLSVPSIGRIYVNDFKAWERDVANEWHHWVPRSSYKITKNSAGNTTKITMSNRSVIYIMTSEMDPGASEGGRVDWVAYNEPPSEAHFKAAQRGLVDRNGSWWMCLTLLQDQPWVFDLVWERADYDENIEVIEGSTLDNTRSRGGVIPDENLEEFSKFLTPEEKAARIEGKPFFLQGRILKAYESRPPWFIDPVPLHPEWPRFMAIDPHPRKPFGAVWAVVDPKTPILYVVRTLYEPHDTINNFVDRVNEIEMAEPFWVYNSDGDPVRGKLGRPLMRYIDPFAVNRDPIAGSNVMRELSERGIRCRSWSKADKDTKIITAQDWISIRDTSGTPVIQTFNTCKDLDKEVRRWYWDKHNKPKKEGDDLIDCLLGMIAMDVVNHGRRHCGYGRWDGADIRLRPQGKLSARSSFSSGISWKPKSSTGY